MKKFILAAFACTAVAGACVLGACGDMSGGADEVAGRKYRLTDYELTYEGDFIESLLDGIDIDSILRPALEQGAWYAFGEDGYLYSIGGTAVPDAALPVAEQIAGERETAYKYYRYEQNGKDITFDVPQMSEIYGVGMQIDFTAEIDGGILSCNYDAAITFPDDYIGTVAQDKVQTFSISCEGEDDGAFDPADYDIEDMGYDDTGEDDAGITGIYVLDYLETGGVRYGIGDEYVQGGQSVTLTEEMFTLALAEDGTLRGSGYGTPFSGTWSMDGDGIVIVSESTLSGTFGDGGTLVLVSGSTNIGLVKTDMSELPDYAPPAEQFEGTYYFVSITTTDGNTVEAGDEINDMPVTDEYYVLQINADGTFTFTYNPLDGSDGMPMEGTWEVTDGTIDMTAELGTMSGQLSGSALTLTANDGTVLEFTRNRGGSPKPDDPGGEAHDRWAQLFFFRSMTVSDGNGGENTYRVGDEPTPGYVIDEFLFVLRITEDGGFKLTLASADGNDTAVSGTWEYDGDGILLLTDDGQEIGAAIDGDPKTGGTVTLTIGGITVILSSDDPEMAEAAGRTELYCDRVTVAGIYLGDELMLGTDPGMVPVRA